MQQEKCVAVSKMLPEPIMDELAASYRLILPRAGLTMTQEEVSAAIGEADALLSNPSEPVTARMLAMPGRRVNVIANFGVGYDNIDLEAARAHGIPVVNTPGVVTECTADIALMLIMMVARKATAMEKILRQGNWPGLNINTHLSTTIGDKTLGIIGMGRIGWALAKRCEGAFGMKVIFHNRSRLDGEALDGLKAEQLDSMEEVLRRSDFVSLHCPGGAQNRHLINSERLSWMKPAAFLINTARGEVVDELALIAALQTGTIAGAGLDVFEDEPHVPAPLIAMDNVTLLPHIGTATIETRLRMGRMAKGAIDAFFAGEEIENRVV